MKIKTNAGEVDLTHEMVMKGMVFESSWAVPGGRPIGQFTVTENCGDGTIWFLSKGGTTSLVGWRGFCDREQPTFLGCDPEIASRADCERFGVYGDAAAHGFAPPRDGGATDLRKARMVIMPPGENRTMTLNPWAGDAVELEKVEPGKPDSTTPIHQSSRKPYDPAPLLAMQRLVRQASPRLLDQGPNPRVVPRTPCPECHADTLCPNGTYHHDRCPAARRMREKTIADTVNAVRDWADPTAWRAAILAFAECHTEDSLRDIRWVPSVLCVFVAYISVGGSVELGGIIYNAHLGGIHRAHSLRGEAL